MEGPPVWMDLKHRSLNVNFKNKGIDILIMLKFRDENVIYPYKNSKCNI